MCITQKHYAFAKLLADLEYRLEKAQSGCGSRTALGRARLLVIMIRQHEEFCRIPTDFVDVMNAYINFLEYAVFWEGKLPKCDSIFLDHLEPRHIMESALGGQWMYTDHEGNPGWSDWILL